MCLYIQLFCNIYNRKEFFTNMKYSIETKKKLCEMICLNHCSTIKTAEEYNIPLKTLEKWITAYNKDSHCFDPKLELINDFSMLFDSPKDSYDDLNADDLKKQLMKKDIEIARLKKGYLVKEGGMGEKVFVTFSKKNTK